MTVVLLLFAGATLALGILGLLDGWRDRVVERQNARTREAGCVSVSVSGTDTDVEGFTVTITPTGTIAPPAFTPADFDALMRHVARHSTPDRVRALRN